MYIHKIEIDISMWKVSKKSQGFYETFNNLTRNLPTSAEYIKFLKQRYLTQMLKKFKLNKKCKIKESAGYKQQLASKSDHSKPRSKYSD